MIPSRPLARTFAPTVSRALARTFARTVAFAILFAAAPAPLPAQEEHEGADFLLRRQAWFEDQRAYPNAQPSWQTIALARKALMNGAGPLSSLLNASSGSWLPLGPNGFFGVGYWDSGPQVDAGRVDAIALHPTAAGSMLIASPNGGLWGTSTGGASWTPLTDFQCTLQMSTVQFDPVNPNLAYAAAANSSGAAGCAILRSTDGGANWASFNGNLAFAAYAGGFINAFYIDPATAGNTSSTTMLFNFNTAGIYRSVTSGNTWTHALSFGYITSIVGLPAKPGVLFAGLADYASTPTSTRSGLYRSADNGVTWLQLQSGAVDFTVTGRFQLAVSPAQPNSVWIIAGSRNSAFQSVSKWDDGTSQLTQLAGAGIDLSSSTRTVFGSQTTYDLNIAVDPADARRIFIAGVRAFRSVDGGATFAPMGTEIHCDWHTIVVDPRNTRQLWAGTDGGVYTSTDGGDHWVSRNSGLVISMYYPGISQHPTDKTVVLGGLQDNGSLLSNGTPLFSAIMGGDGGFAAINYASPSELWSTCQWSTTTGPCIQRRMPAAAGFNYGNVSGGIDKTDRAQFIPPLVMDPVTPTTLYFGTMRLYRTVNDGALWIPLSGDLSKGNGSIKAIAVAKSDPLTIYVGTSDGNVQVSRDGGTTFTLSVSGLPNRAVTSFAIDRQDPTRAIVTFSGSGAAHVFLTTSAGQLWTSITGSLYDVPVNASVMIDDGQNHFFIGTDIGTFETADGGLTWSNTPFGLPNVVVHDVSYNPATKQLVAATYGRGLFSYSLANPAAVLRGDVNRDGVVNAFDALLIQQALVGLQLPSGFTSLPHGDTNCNGKLEAADALITLRAAVGLTTAGACVGTNR
jgi:photosystem II stability/assembly factor-like uncharacterized protein